MGKKIFGHLLFVAALAGCVAMTLLMGSQGTRIYAVQSDLSRDHGCPVFCRSHRRFFPDERPGA